MAKKTKKSSTKFNFLPLIIILIILLLGFAIFYFKNQTSDKVSNVTNKTSTDVVIDTTGWAPYENKELGFKFFFPQDWKLEMISPEYKSFGIHLNPQNYIDYENDKYGIVQHSLVGFSVRSFEGKSFEKIYNEYKTTFAPQEGYEAKPSYTFDFNGLKGFYINQYNNSYSDNNYFIRLSPDKYLIISNRESEQHYTPGGKSVDDKNDFTQYSPIVKQIVKTISPLNK